MFADNEVDVLFWQSRPFSEYCYDVYVGSVWVASAKNQGAADYAAIEYQQYRTDTVEPPLYCEYGPPECPYCARSITRCPVCDTTTIEPPIDVEYAPIGW